MLRTPHAGQSPDDLFGFMIHDGDHIQFPDRYQEISGGEDRRSMRRGAVQHFQGVGVEDVALVFQVIQEGAVHRFLEGLQQVDGAQNLALGRKMGDVVDQNGLAVADPGNEFGLAGQDIDGPVGQDLQIMMAGPRVTPDQAGVLVDQGQAVAFENRQHPAVWIQKGPAPAAGHALGVGKEIGRGIFAFADALIVGQPPGMQDLAVGIHQVGGGLVAGSEKPQSPRSQFPVVGRDSGSGGGRHRSPGVPQAAQTPHFLGLFGAEALVFGPVVDSPMAGGFGPGFVSTDPVADLPGDIGQGFFAGRNKTDPGTHDQSDQHQQNGPQSGQKRFAVG